MVYDASARSGGPSLNDCLHVGPKFNQKILEILLRFRVHDVAVVADIEKAFLMISINQRDRDALRFLWVSDLDKQPPDICAYRFTRVVFGVACSPFLLNATLSQHVDKYRTAQPNLVNQLQRSIYVDDVVLGAKTAELAHQLCSESRKLMSEGGFNLRKFLTNHGWLRDKLAKEEKSKEGRQYETYTSTMLGKSQAPLHRERKVLGVRWNTVTDELVLSTGELASMARQVCPTKRQVVSTVGRFYDPLGILSPVLLPFKVFFQKLCKADVTWDQPLQGELFKEWNELLSGLTDDRLVRRPRCYRELGSPPVDGKLKAQLYGFCDASLKAYAAVVYLVMETGRERVPRLVCAKTRVAPLKELTLPRLELLSGLLLARLLHTVTSSLETELQLSPPQCFTDSKVSYHWIRGSNKGWKPFVQNRVNEIRKLVPADQWHHCPGRDNPADLPSRGLPLTELIDNQLWFEGPPWLSEPLSLDLTQPATERDVPRECLLELRATGHALALMTVVKMDALIQLEGYSNLNQLLRVSAYLLLFVQRVRGRDVTFVDMIIKAEQWWACVAQGSMRSDDKFEVLKRQLNLFQDPQGMWRCKGRIHNADLPYSTKFPILLPNYHHFTRLVVLRAHERVFHNGVKETLTEVRSQYWITNGRAVIQKMVHDCSTCQRLEALAYRAPPPPPLPAFTVTEAPAFSYVGVDFAGPLYI